MSTSWTKNVFLYYDDDEAWDGTCDHVKKNEAKKNLALLSKEERQAKEAKKLLTPCKRSLLVDQVKRKKKKRNKRKRTKP